jgi:uncharacterized metal-binding protein YceD (DUF177 family)
MSEFSRPERVDSIGEGERSVTIQADEAERAALARRFDLVAIESLGATLALRREAAGIHVSGHVTAALTQSCSITDDPIPVAIDESVALLFVAPGSAGGDEVELGEDSLDTVELEGSSINLGEIAAETMALALDPYPRGPNAAAALKAAGVLTEEEARPASPFAALKDRLGKQ